MSCPFCNTEGSRVIEIPSFCEEESSQWAMVCNTCHAAGPWVARQEDATLTPPKSPEMRLLIVGALMAHRDYARASNELKKALNARCKLEKKLRRTQEMVDALTRAVEAKAELRWIPVIEKLPAPNTEVIVHVGELIPAKIQTMQRGGVWMGWEPTHWMPLPPVPLPIETSKTEVLP